MDRLLSKTENLRLREGLHLMELHDKHVNLQGFQQSRIVGTVTVREMLTGSNNLHIEAVAEDSTAVDTISTAIDALELEIISIDVIKETHVQPFDHFGPTPQTDNADHQ